MSDLILSASGVRKRFDGRDILKGVSLSLQKGDVVAIIGRSGSGKSTFLRCLAELERIDAAGSADEARELLAQREYHIFLCDIVMPDEDGITFAKWILSRYPYSKFIFLTAHADFKYMREAVSIKNSFDYLLKPFKKERVMQTLERAKKRIRHQTDGETPLPVHPTPHPVSGRLMKLVAAKHRKKQVAPMPVMPIDIV